MMPLIFFLPSSPRAKGSLFARAKSGLFSPLSFAQRFQQARARAEQARQEAAWIRAPARRISSQNHPA